MEERYEEKKKDIKNTLRGKTNQEKIKDIDERIFNMEMIDYLDSEDRNIISMLQEIKRELEKENK